MNHDLTYGSRSASWSFDWKGTTFKDYMDGYVNSQGRIVFNVQYLGPYVPPNLRSFWTISASAGGYADWSGSASASSDPSQKTSTGYGTASSSGNKVVEVKGEAANIEVSFSATATQPQKYDINPLAQLAGSIRAHPHPTFTLIYNEPGNRSRTGENKRDGSMKGTLDIATRWTHLVPRDDGVWWGNAPYKWSQELYGQPGYSITGIGDEQWSEANSGTGQIIAGGLGTDTTRQRLGVTNKVKSKLRDRSDPRNPDVDIETTIRWHKPVENPVLVPKSNYTVERACKVVSVTAKPNLPANMATKLEVRYIRPGAQAEISPEVERVLSIIWSEATGRIPELNLIKDLGDLSAEDFFPKDAMGYPSFMQVFDARFEDSTDRHRMGLGIINENEPQNHRLQAIIGVYLWFTRGEWDVETYSTAGYGGQGKVTTYRELANEAYQGRFIYIDPNGPPPPPDGTGAGGSGGPQAGGL